MNSVKDVPILHRGDMQILEIQEQIVSYFFTKILIPKSKQRVILLTNNTPKVTREWPMNDPWMTHEWPIEDLLTKKNF